MFLYRIDKNTQERFKKTSIAPLRLINTQILDFIFKFKVSLKFIVVLNKLNYICFIVILGRLTVAYLPVAPHQVILLYKKYEKGTNRRVICPPGTGKYEKDLIEYWSARDLQQILEYAEWRNFMKVINKAKTAL